MYQSIDKIANSIFKIQSSEQFEAIALKIFQYQAIHTPIYKAYLQALNCDPAQIKNTLNIPFLPISFFKTHPVQAFTENPEAIFLSSATTGSVQSKHPVKSLALYEKIFTIGFEAQYGPIQEYTILALLPSYLDRSGSSLIYMVNHFIQNSSNPQSGFHKTIDKALIQKIKTLTQTGTKTLLIGVSYALMDLADQIDFSLAGLVIMETGGMKGNRPELPKEELQAYLKKGFKTDQIHSEYGMTELLSQAYSKKDGIFTSPPWLKIRTRELNDPFSYTYQKTGAINIIDLANVYSCSFIATDDLGIVYPNEDFKVLGRLSGADTRGCNLLYEDTTFFQK